MLGVLHFLRSFFQTPEPGAHLPGEGETGAKQLPPCPAEAEELGWSQQTDHNDLGTPSPQGESQSHAKTNPVESVSDAEPPPGDLAGGTSVDRAGCWERPDAPAATPPQEYPSTSVPDLLAPQEERDLSLELKEPSYKRASRALAAVPREDKAGHPWDCVASREREALSAGDPHHPEGGDSLHQAKVVTVQDLGGLSAISLLQSRSDGCLCITVVSPSLLQCYELGRSWPYLHDRAEGPGLPLRSPLDSTAPLGVRATKGHVPGPSVNTDVPYHQPCFDDPHHLPLGTSCLLYTKLCHSTPGNIGDKGRAPPGYHCPHRRTLTRAHSISGFPLRHPDDLPGQSSVTFGRPWKGRAEVERDIRTPNPSHPAATQASPVLPASQSMAPYVPGKDKPSALCCSRAAQDTPSANLGLENQLGQDSGSCPGSSLHTAELTSLSTEEEAVPVACKSEHGPESSQEGPPGTGPAPDAAEASGQQMHLRDIAVEAGNQTSNYTIKYIPTEKRKPPAGAKFPHHHSGNSGSQVRNGDGTGSSPVSDHSDAPETTLKSRATDTSEEAEHVMVLDPGCTEDAPQGFSEGTPVVLCHRSCGFENCARELGSQGMPFAGAGLQEPSADTSSRGTCTLIIIAVEQKGLQATRRVAALPESQSCQFLEGRPGSPCSAELPAVGKPHVGTKESELPAAPRLGADDGALGQVGCAEELGAVLTPQAASGGEETWSPEPAKRVLSTEVSGEETSRLPKVTTTTFQKSLLPGAQEDTTEVSLQGALGEDHVHTNTAPTATANQQGALSEDHAHTSSAPDVEGTAPCEGTSGSLRSGGLASDDCEAGPLRPPEKWLRARLAVAHRTLASFFESKALDREDPGGRSAASVRGPKEKGGRLPSAWRALLRSRGAPSPPRPVPGAELEALPPLGPSPRGTRGRGPQPQAQDTEGCASGAARAPPPAPTASSPGSSASPGSRRRSEPALACASPREGSWFLRSGVVPAKSWLVSSSGPRAQRAGDTHSLPSVRPGAPSRPVSPKPQSPRPGALCYPGMGGAVSVVFLGSFSDAESSPEAPERPKAAKPGASSLLSLQTLDQDGLKQESGERCHLSAAPSLRGLPGRENHVPWEGPAGRKPSGSRAQEALHMELRTSQRPFSTAEVVTWTLPSIPAADAPQGAPSWPRRTPQLSHSSLDDLWLEKTQRRKLEMQARAERQMYTETAGKDGAQCWRKRMVTSPASPRLPRSRPFSQSVPTGLDLVGWPEHTPDPGIPVGALDTATCADETGSEEDLYEDVCGHSHHYRRAAGGGEQLAINELIGDGSAVCAEALWDHVTMDDQELGFNAGDVIEVMDATNREWWWGRVADGEGWFPASFVRLRVNQDERFEDAELRAADGGAADSGAETQSSRDQMRTNVVHEILGTERDYIKHLRDICEGYIRQCRSRADMFSEEQLRTIFGNIEDIYRCQKAFLRALELRVNRERPHLSELGACFLEHQADFQIYSEYCNNHPSACVELSRLAKLSKYVYFFEACRLLQKMIDISLDGFLLTPVQKICKYPLQLAELLKYTHPEHRDFKDVEAALRAMKNVARLINERKRRLENIDKIARWQSSIEDWEGEDLLVRSSELIHSGELTRVSEPRAKSQQRMFFLFDHQLIYCKKDLLRRDVLYYKGRMDTDRLEVLDLQDKKDRDLHVSIKNAFRLCCGPVGESFLLCARKPAQKQRWLRAFAREREQVRLDQETGFCITELQRKQAMLNASKQQVAGKPKALGRPYPLTRQKPPALTSWPWQPAPAPAPAEPKRKPSSLWHSISRLAPFRK